MRLLSPSLVGYRANSPGSTGGCRCKDASLERLLFHIGEAHWLSEALALVVSEAPLRPRNLNKWNPDGSKCGVERLAES